MCDKSNDLDRTLDMTDEEMDSCFIKAVAEDIQDKQARGLPIARYDHVLKKAYLEHPDGSREYISQLS